MTSEEITKFIDCVTFEDCTVKLENHFYWCIGLEGPFNDKTYYIGVYECGESGQESIRTLLDYSSPSREECMKHFLEDKYWDGKSFYEVAHIMEWTDL